MPGTRVRRVNCPCVLQMEAAECGAASLAMILAYHGRHVPLEELRHACGVSRDGSKASNILKAARKYGLTAKGFKKELDELWELVTPYIVFWNFNHFLVVLGHDRTRVFLNDPAGGPRTVSRAEFDEGYTGVVLTFEPGEEFSRGGLKPGVVQALSRRLAGSREPLLYTFLAGLLLILPMMTVPIFTQIFVDQILVQQMEDWLRPLLIGMGVCYALMGALSLLELSLLSRLRLKLAIAMSGRFLWHCIRLPAAFFAQRFPGEIASRIDLNEKAAQEIAGPLARSFVDAVKLLVFAALMAAYDVGLTGVALALASLNFVALRLVERQNTDASLRLGMDFGKAAGVSIAGLQSIETLKSSGLEGDFFARWAGYYTKAVNTQQEIGARNLIVGSLPGLLNALTVMLVLVLGGFRVIEGHMSIGMLVAYQGMMANFQTPLSNLVSFGQRLQWLAADLARVDDVTANPVDVEAEERPLEEGSPGEPVRLSGHLELRGVSFGYNRLEPPLIERFDLVLKPGQRVALVGPSGSGKSTLARLILGLYQPWEGEILLDGRPRRSIPRPVLNQAVAMVDQDLFLFSGSVRDNLTMWDDTATDREILEACKEADVHEVIARMPGSYQGALKEGATNLSGGQRQRIEIARALARNPAILVLDEATSALDSESERVIDRNIRRRGCTCVIVAHRLSTIKDCDEIIVFDRGRIVQRGTHEELKQAPGLYADLVQSEARPDAGVRV